MLRDMRTMERPRHISRDHQSSIIFFLLMLCLLGRASRAEVGVLSAITGNAARIIGFSHYILQLVSAKLFVICTSVHHGTPNRPLPVPPPLQARTEPRMMGKDPAPSPPPKAKARLLLQLRPQRTAHLLATALLAAASSHSIRSHFPSRPENRIPHPHPATAPAVRRRRVHAYTSPDPIYRCSIFIVATEFAGPRHEFCPSYPRLANSAGFPCLKLVRLKKCRIRAGM
ncbi:hypothetical protein B0H67DRAFT_589898 [Lasiosphaeris hirsuta]|uniref:Uncharacterized protein n=1 Tax=Lasiosphaeris hirsuta TaxID=260670 RepID=A0AA40A2X4_9PEZI|nr:hypothetical protein B0H67DRAFT_589898 [Lasiosphaeris hirsuta]